MLHGESMILTLQKPLVYVRDRINGTNLGQLSRVQILQSSLCFCGQMTPDLQVSALISQVRTMGIPPHSAELRINEVESIEYEGKTEKVTLIFPRKLNSHLSFPSKSI